LDALGDEAFGGPPPSSSAPKKGPPARFAAKTAVQPDADEEMKDETVPVVVKKPAPKPKEEEKKAPAKPAAAAKPGATAGAPKGPSIQEENVGEGLSKEEAEARFVETFSADIVANLEDSKKWNEKQEGYKALQQSIIEMQPEPVVLEAVVKYVRDRTKQWKESNINIIKEVIALFTVMAQQTEKLNKRSVAAMMTFLSDKLGDVKFSNLVGEVAMAAAEVVTPKFIANQIMNKTKDAKSPNVPKETCNLLVRMTDDFGVLSMPLKEMIDYAILAVNNSNPQVRTAAMALFSIIYRHAGEAVRNFFKDIKESTMKLIEDELGKVTPYKKGEYQKKRNFRGEAAREEAAALAAAAGAGGKKGAGAAAGGGGLDDLLPRTDISKQLNSKLMPLFNDKDWKKRVEAATKVSEIIKAANMRIKPDGLNELMDMIK
jgi:hypothetical protein